MRNIISGTRFSLIVTETFETSKNIKKLIKMTINVQGMVNRFDCVFFSVKNLKFIFWKKIRFAKI